MFLVLDGAGVGEGGTYREDRKRMPFKLQRRDRGTGRVFGGFSYRVRPASTKRGNGGGPICKEKDVRKWEEKG